MDEKSEVQGKLCLILAKCFLVPSTSSPRGDFNSESLAVFPGETNVSAPKDGLDGGTFPTPDTLVCTPTH